MNEGQIDYLFFKLNYQSRFTLASSHQKDTTSPLLPLSQRHLIYTTRYLETERFKRKSQQKYKEGKRQINNITIEEEDCILIEETDDLQVQLSEEQQLQSIQEQSRSCQFMNRNEDENNWIKIEQDNENELDSLFSQKIVYQESFYQQSQKEQQRGEESAYSTKYKKIQKQQLVETGVNFLTDSEDGHNMTRNYTFGNNLNQNAFFQVLNKSKEIQQRRQYQKLISSIQLQFQNQTKKNTTFSLNLQVVEDNDGSEDVNQVISPKFADLTSFQSNKLNIKNEEYLIDQVNTQNFNKIQTPKSKTQKRYRSSKKYEKNTSPKSSKSSSQRSKVSSQEKKQSFKKSDFVNQMSQSKKSDIVIQQSQQPYEEQRYKNEKTSPTLNKSRIYDQSIHKIDSIMNLLPPKLKNTYLGIKHQLLEKQRDFKQKLQVENKKIKVLKTLLQLKNLGPKLQDFILQQSNTQQETIILNQIILRLLIIQVAKQNNFFPAKEQL